ncbi:nuclear transport factor 2 family protein [Planococcus sp. X10-3]|uniref:nuclear transport factor 2 family protein n=1 Tax=Planococcus sp. X10-3 TaxID=3061240 RepID=UPI003BB0A954
MEELAKPEFFRKFNAAFFQGDQDFIEEHVTDDVVWSIVGTESVKGKQGLLDAAFGIADFNNTEYNIESVICNKGEAAVKGVTKRTDENGKVRNFCYCDVYTLDTEQPEKVKSIITFVIELQKEQHANSY